LFHADRQMDGRKDMAKISPLCNFPNAPKNSRHERIQDAEKHNPRLRIITTALGVWQPVSSKDRATCGCEITLRSTSYSPVR
jgi:hypothetical protein